jgi:hypothetical protein
MLKYFRNKGKHIIGFSATPIRSDKKSQANILEIYHTEARQSSHVPLIGESSMDNKKINLISNYTLIDALKDKIVLPFKHYVLNPIHTDEYKLKKFLKGIYKGYIRDNPDLPYKKGISWSRCIKDIDNNSTLFKIIKKVFKNMDIYRTYSGKSGVNEIDDFYKKENNALLLCINRCKEGSDIVNLDYGLLLDNVVNRNINVWLQMAGRLMRPDKEGLKKYATIIECINLDDQKDKKGSKELMTVRKIMDYYQMILNMSSYDIGDMEYARIVNQFEQLYKNTFINKTENEIHINLTGLSDGICIIKFEDTTIDWSLFEMYLRQNVNERVGQNISIEDDYKNTIEKIKNISIFKNDVHFWDEYEKLDYKQLNILSPYELKNNYKNIWDTKTWYQVLDINKMSYLDLQLYISDYKTMDSNIYLNLCKDNPTIPLYPYEYYKYSGWSGYDNLIMDKNEIIF